MLTLNKFIYTGFLIACLTLIYCNRDTNFSTTESTYLNLQDSVQYMGMQTCRSCHEDVYNSFVETGMGRSFDVAKREKSDAVFDEHALVYDKHHDLYYLPYFKDSIFYIKEFRLENNDTVFQRIERINYIVGSGQHTNSHILDFNGYIFQAPITYYTQDGRWDMAPGFKEGKIDRFDRFLTSECITCHNHLPTLAEGSINKFSNMPTGIECERCHGPGEIHVKEKLAGHIVDTSTQIDYSIVNPIHLERDLQMDICQRCHLQGVAVLQNDKTFYDFKPGMKLSDIMNVFLPRYTNSHEKFIMASQADRLKMSSCFLETEDLTCLTCHDPHHTVSSKTDKDFNAACEKCHQENSSKCSIGEVALSEENNNCIKCHMPPSGSIDIPHVRITDHFISKKTAVRKEKEITDDEQNEIAQFLGLKILTKEKATPLEMAKGYIALFDKYVDHPTVLDSAQFYLKQSRLSKEEKLTTLIHYHFAKNEYNAILDLVKNKKAYDFQDGWTAYRIGESFYKNNSFDNALQYYLRATEFLPYHLDFQEKKGSAQLALKQIQQAEKTFNFILKENPKRKKALCNLGFIQANYGNFRQAEEHYNAALALDPDYEQALINKTALLVMNGVEKEAEILIKRVLKINPDNLQAQQILARLKQ